MRIAAVALALGATLPFLPQQTKPSADRVARAEVGEPAPAFRLNDHTGRAVALGGPREEWTVVAFFPKAMTPG